MSKTKEQLRAEYAERKQAKIERFKELADKHGEKSRERARLSGAMASHIPMGQPILVGHHSEKADRAYRERIDNHMRKSVEHENAADYFERRVESIENNTSIASDDPDAKEKLESKIMALERHSDFMKAANQWFRKNGTLDSFPITEEARSDIEQTMIRMNRNIPYESWEFTNLRGKIKAAKQRIAALSKANDFEAFEVNGIKVDIVGGQIQVDFGFKPDEETRAKLKTFPLALKWSSYSKRWVRKFTGQGPGYFNELRKLLEKAKEPNV